MFHIFVESWRDWKINTWMRKKSKLKKKVMLDSNAAGLGRYELVIFMMSHTSRGVVLKVNGKVNICCASLYYFYILIIISRLRCSKMSMNSKVPVNSNSYVWYVLYTTIHSVQRVRRASFTYTWNHFSVWVFSTKLHCSNIWLRVQYVSTAPGLLTIRFIIK